MKTVLKKIIVLLITLEARLILKKYKPTIVGITGSVGKTSTKDAVYAVLATTYFVRKSEKSFNTEFGVPLTIIGAKNAWSNPTHWLLNLIKGLMLTVLPCRYPKWLVLEIGADQPRDIQKLVAWVKPDIGIMTKLADVPAHVEFFESPEALRAEKATLISAIKKSGTLIYNADDGHVREMALNSPVSKISFGLNTPAYIQASHVKTVYKSSMQVKKPTGFTFQAAIDGNSLPVEICGALGIQHVYPTMAAIAVAKVQGIGMITAIEALKNFETTRGRMRLISGIKHSTIIDDTYNSSPVAIVEALVTLKSLVISGKKIAVLADMLELGKYSHEEHRKAGELVPSATDILVTVGMRARTIATSALSSGMNESNVFQFDSPQEAGKFIEPLIEKGDVILVKGSQSLRLERTVLEIMEHPELASALLVRQESEWLAR